MRHNIYQDKKEEIVTLLDEGWNNKQIVEIIGVGTPTSFSKYIASIGKSRWKRQGGSKCIKYDFDKKETEIRELLKSGFTFVDVAEYYDYTRPRESELFQGAVSEWICQHWGSKTLFTSDVRMHKTQESIPEYSTGFTNC